MPIPRTLLEHIWDTLRHLFAITCSPLLIRGQNYLEVLAAAEQLGERWQENQQDRELVLWAQEEEKITLRIRCDNLVEQLESTRAELAKKTKN